MSILWSRDPFFTAIIYIPLPFAVVFCSAICGILIDRGFFSATVFPLHSGNNITKACCIYWYSNMTNCSLRQIKRRPFAKKDRHFIITSFTGSYPIKIVIDLFWDLYNKNCSDLFFDAFCVKSFVQNLRIICWTVCFHPWLTSMNNLIMIRLPWYHLTLKAIVQCLHGEKVTSVFY